MQDYSIEKKIEKICKETGNVRQLKALFKTKVDLNINLINFVSYFVTLYI